MVLGVPILKHFRVVFLSDGQGTVRQAIQFVDRYCFVFLYLFVHIQPIIYVSPRIKIYIWYTVIIGYKTVFFCPSRMISNN